MHTHIKGTMKRHCRVYSTFIRTYCLGFTSSRCISSIAMIRMIKIVTIVILLLSKKSQGFSFSTVCHPTVCETRHTMSSQSIHFRDIGTKRNSMLFHCMKDNMHKYQFNDSKRRGNRMSRIGQRQHKFSTASTSLFALNNSATTTSTSLLQTNIQYFFSKFITIINQQYHHLPSLVSSSSLSSLPSLIVFTISSTITRLKQYIITCINSIQQQSSPKSILRAMVYTSFVIYTIHSIRESIQTRRRQSIDATSEWGRYADYPSIRGKALMGLMGKITIWMMVARFINMLPGGEYSFLGKKSNSKKKKEDLKIELDVKQDQDQELKQDDAPGVKSIEIDSAANTVEGKSSSWASQKAKLIRQKSGNKLADGLLRLGPLYIKIGQILSCRENLLPPEWIISLERLQDRVPAKSGQEALQLAYDAYDGNITKFHSIFKEFDDVPIAAASLGQVHKAILQSNNQTVAIKLQRSRLRDIYDKDLSLMKKVAKIVDTFMGKMGQVGGVKQSWEEIFNDAETILYREIDYRDEANNAMRFASDFGLGLDGKAIECTASSLDGKPLPSASSWIRTPFVYDEYSTEKILVMEYVPSIKISDERKLKEAGISWKDREYLSECLARAYLRQFCVNKFFSTDPHPGNLGVEIIKDGSIKPRLVFYDFGQACDLKDDQAGGILDVIEGIVDTNVDNCVNAFIRMGVLVDGADLGKVKAKVKSNFESGLIKVKAQKNHRKGKEIDCVVQVREATDKDRALGDKSASSRENAPQLLLTQGSNDSDITTPTQVSNLTKSTTPGTITSTTKVDDAEIMSYFTLPAEYAFVARAISQMDGVGKSLDADFDFISASAPYIVEIKGGELYIKDEIMKKVIDPILQWQLELQRSINSNFAGFIRESKNDDK